MPIVSVQNLSSRRLPKSRWCYLCHEAKAKNPKYAPPAKRLTVVTGKNEPRVMVGETAVDFDGLVCEHTVALGLMGMNKWPERLQGGL